MWYKTSKYTISTKSINKTVCRDHWSRYKKKDGDIEKYGDTRCIVVKCTDCEGPLRATHGFLKAMSHEAICPWNLQCNFCRKKYCRLQLGCQTYATCFAACNEIIFYVRRVFKNVSGILIMSYCDWFLLKKIARQVAVGVPHAAT